MATSSSEQLWSDRNLAVTVEDPDGARRTVRVAKPYARIGSHDRAEVVLTGADVSPCHLYLHATDEGIYGLGLAGSASNGWLDTERSIKVGRYRISAAFDDGGPPPRAPDHNPAAKESIAPPLPRLRIRLTGDKKHAFELNLRRQLTVMGRHAPSTLCVHHSTISRTHAVLFWDGQSLWVVDLLGANGIRRDGESLDAGLLAPSQRIALGDVRCRYLGAQPNVAESGEARESRDESRDAEPVGPDRDAEPAEAAHEIVRLQDELATAARARELAEDSAAAYQRRLDELTAGHAALQAEAAAVRQELAASQVAIVVHQTAGEQRIADLREALHEQLNSVSAARELAERAAAERAAALAHTQGDVLRLQTELAAVVAARDSAETAASQFEADLTAAQQQLAAVREQGTALQAAGDEQVAALREQLASAAAERVAAERLAVERNRVLDEATENVSRLESELAETRQLLGASEEKRTNLRTAADERLADLREQLARDVHSAAAAREAAEMAAVERKRALDEATENVSRLEAQLTETRRLHAASQEEQKSLRATADAQIAAIQEQLSRDVASALTAREVAEQMADERKRELDKAAENARRLESELSEARHLLVASQQDQTNLRTAADEQVAALRAKLTEELASVKTAREASDRVAAERKLALDKAVQDVLLLETQLAETRRLLADSQKEQSSLRTAADEQIAALREQMSRDLASAAAARKTAEQLAAERERATAEATQNVARLEEALAVGQRQLASARDEFAAFKANADEHVAALRQSHQHEIERVTVALQASANECLAALEESTRQEIADLEAERDQNRQALLAGQAELADARRSIEQLQAELAATRDELLAYRADENTALPEALADEQLEATPAASLPKAQLVTAARDTVPPGALEPESPVDALPTEETQWVLDDRVIGRLLDFRAKRESGRRRKLLWGAAACLAIICLGAAAAAGRAWSARRQPADAPAASSDVDKLIREALIEPGLR